MTTSPRTILRIHFHTAAQDDALYEQLLTVLEGITPRVQAHPADFSATVDLTGALRYWSRDAAGVTALIWLRILALYGIQTSAGVGPNVGIATMAAASTPPGAVTVVGDDPYAIAAFLRPQPAAALPGIGPTTARTLSNFGLRTIGDVADTPLPTLQRILGTASGRHTTGPAVSTTAP